MNNKKKEIINILIVIVLIVVGVLISKNAEKVISPIEENIVQETLNSGDNIRVESNQKVEKDIKILISDKDGNNIFSGDVETEAMYLIDALNETENVNVVFENGPYGAYITEINGIKQEDGYYWTYYINDEYASVGASTCEIEDGKTYSFKIEKF